MNYSVKETMSSDLIMAHVDESLVEAYAKLKKNMIRHLPVRDDYGRIVGVISDRDFQRGMKLNKYEDAFLVHSDIQFVDGAKVCNFMSWPVKTISAEASLSEASWEMMDYKISALLVTEKKSVVGIITHEDLLRVLVELLPSRAPTDKRLITKIREWSYKSPIGQIAKFFSDSGI